MTTGCLELYLGHFIPEVQQKYTHALLTVKGGNQKAR